MTEMVRAWTAMRPRLTSLSFPPSGVIQALRERGLRSAVQGDVICAFSFDHPEHHRQLEPPRTGAGGIEQKHAIDDLVVWSMTMTEHDDVGLLLEQLGSKNVRQENSPVADGHSDDVVAVGIIGVAANECDRRDRAQRFDHMLAADVAGVQDRIHTSQRSKRLGTNQTVRIGDDANARITPRLTLSSPRRSLCSGP